MQVYEGLTFKLSLKFPTSYPYEAPQVTFVTPCFHPNVDQYGNICLDILKEKWSAVYNVRTILLSIQSLLGGTQRPPARMRRALSSPAARDPPSSPSPLNPLCHGRPES